MESSLLLRVRILLRCQKMGTKLAICWIVGVTSFAFVANPGEPETVIVCFLYSLILIFQACDYVQ